MTVPPVPIRQICHFLEIVLCILEIEKITGPILYLLDNIYDNDVYNLIVEWHSLEDGEEKAKVMLVIYTKALAARRKEEDNGKNTRTKSDSDSLADTDS